MSHLAADAPQPDVLAPEDAPVVAPTEEPATPAPPRPWWRPILTWLRTPLSWLIVAAVLASAVAGVLLYENATRFDPRTMASYEHAATSGDLSALAKEIKAAVGSDTSVTATSGSIYDPASSRNGSADTTIQVITGTTFNGQQASDPELMKLKDTVETVIWRQHFDIGQFALSVKYRYPGPDVLLDRTSRRDKLTSLGITPTVDLADWPKAGPGLRMGATEDKPRLESLLKALPHVTTVTITCLCNTPFTVWYHGNTKIDIATDLPTTPLNHDLGWNPQQEDLLKVANDVRRLLWQQPYAIGSAEVLASTSDEGHKVNLLAHRGILEAQFGGARPAPAYGEASDATAVEATAAALPGVESTYLFCNCSEVTESNGTKKAFITVGAYLTKAGSKAAGAAQAQTVADGIERALWARGVEFGPMRIEALGYEAKVVVNDLTLADLIAKFGIPDWDKRQPPLNPGMR
ncbi:MAG TPA: hypothetical protein DEH05_03710 [Propionibacteriaceae bacterium]|nr:hypothetical protein [Propionibacteriaceae bacterium]